jgi:hypothetical protein
VAVTKDEWIKNLRRAAVHFESEYESAAASGRWLSAYESRLSGLIWRAAALAIQHGFVDHRLNLGAGALDLARLMRAEVMAAADDLEPSRDETSPFRKAEIVIDLLSSLLDGVGVMEAWTRADPKEPPFTALRGFELGRAEVALSLAERGHWEQVAAWSNRRVGRGKGYREPWRVAIAPTLQGWIDDDPKATIKTLMIKMWDWLEEYAAHEKDFSLPDFESLRKAVETMHEQGLISHPRWA